MGNIAVNEVTESWKDKIFEMEYTKFFMEALKSIMKAQVTPTIENVKEAYANVKGISYALLESKTFGEQFSNKIEPELKKIELVLYGDDNNVEKISAMSEYGVFTKKDRIRQTQIININNIITQLWEIFRFTKIWAYRLGFFAKKPYDRKYGMEGIEEGFLM